MPLRLKGTAPKPGEVDRRYYMIDVQEGKRRERISSGTRNLALAQRKEQMVLDALRNDINVPREYLVALVRGDARAAQASLYRGPAPRTLKEACDAALNDPVPWTKAKHGWARARSRSTYATNCKMLQKMLGPTMPVHKIDQEVVDKLVLDLLDAGDSEATVNRKLYTLLAVLRREKLREGLTTPLPTYRPFDEDENARDFTLTPQQEAELFEQVLALDKLPEGPKGGHPRKRDAHEYHDLFVFLADVGCRLEAALRVRWTDIVEQEGRWYVRFWRKSELKGGKERTTPLSARAAQVIARRRLKGGTGPFSQLSKRRAQHLWARAKSRTSLAGEKECVIHCLRHTCATRMLAATGDIKLVQEWLGHSVLATTEGIYAKVLTHSKVRALDAYEAMWLNAARDAGIPVAGDIRDRNHPETGTTSSVIH